MSGKFIPVQIPPGVVSNPTKQMASSNWAEANLMRWVEGRLTPVGGQAQYTYQFASRCRAIHGWYDLSGQYRIAYLCESNLYVDTNGTLKEITPSNGIGGSYLISPLNLGGYGVGAYSYGTYGTGRPSESSWPKSVLPDVYSLDNFGGILLAMASTELQGPSGGGAVAGRLLKWDPTTSINILVEAAIGAAFAKGATTITMAVPFPPPNSPAIPVGATVWNMSTGKSVGTIASYLGGATPSITLQSGAASASLGANDGLEFYSTNPADTVAVQVPSNDTGTGFAPSGRGFVVTPERFVWIYGTQGDGTQSGGNQRRFVWCDQENFSAWNFASVTSQAGFLDIEPSSPIVTALATPHGILFWTAQVCYLSQFLGLPFVYNYNEVAKACTPWSPKSMASTASTVTYWMSEQGFFGFDGTSVQPVPCNVRTWIEDDIDKSAVRSQACAVHCSDFNEWWWFFPQVGQQYNTRVVIYNYKEGWWSMGTMSRSAGVTASYTVHTIMADGLVVYQHELGTIYSADAPMPWVESFDLNLTSGARLITLKQLIPDIDGDANNLRYSLFSRMSRSVANGQLVVENQTTPQPVRPDGYVDFRTTGRDIRLKIELAGPIVNPVTVGQHLFDGAPRGDR